MDKSIEPIIPSITISHDDDPNVMGDAYVRAYEASQARSLIDRSMWHIACNSVTCGNCGHQNRTFEASPCVSLPINATTIFSTSGGMLTLEDCLAASERGTFAPEYICDVGCKMKSRNTVHAVSVQHASDIFVIHLKRFETAVSVVNNKTISSTFKIQTAIDFPVDEQLELHTHNDNKTLSYELFAVCHHIGSKLTSGHYISTCKNPVNGLW